MFHHLSLLSDASFVEISLLETSENPPEVVFADDGFYRLLLGEPFSIPWYALLPKVRIYPVSIPLSQRQQCGSSF